MAKSGPIPLEFTFFGEHQAGIVTPQQQHVYFAAFDLIADKREDVAALLRAWTEAAARMSLGMGEPSEKPTPARPWAFIPHA
jgi:deferrochelatase/peroxidase EfeB